MLNLPTRTAVGPPSPTYAWSPPSSPTSLAIDMLNSPTTSEFSGDAPTSAAPTPVAAEPPLP
eukprot:3853422-Alexandrium_andersonii.AAC.1